MNQLTMIANSGNLLSKIGFQLSKHAPKLLMGGGILSVVAGTVLACRATTKVSAVLDKAKGDVAAVHTVLESKKNDAEYSEKDSKKDLAIIYAQTGLELAKLYLPSIGLSLAGFAGILTSHNMMSRRNAALAAAYATVSTGFGEYRERVTKRFGEDVEREIRNNLITKESKETIVDENGKEKKVKKTVTEIGEGGPSDFAKVYREGDSEFWEPSAKYSRTFLHAQQNYANDKLRAKGYLTLNEVYEMLGFQPTKAGQFVGWVYSKYDPNGDNYVDFGIRHLTEEADYARPVPLDFNVDGYIWDDAVDKKLIAEV